MYSARNSWPDAIRPTVCVFLSWLEIKIAKSNKTKEQRRRRWQKTERERQMEEKRGGEEIPVTEWRHSYNNKYIKAQLPKSTSSIWWKWMKSFISIACARLACISLHNFYTPDPCVRTRAHPRPPKYSRASFFWFDFRVRFFFAASSFIKSISRQIAYVTVELITKFSKLYSPAFEFVCVSVAWHLEEIVRAY